MKRLLSLLISILLLQACQEYYTDPDIDNGGDQMVVEGLITNEPGPYVIKITKTLPYNKSNKESSVPVPISNVMVSITDNSGKTEQLTENENGIYYTSPEGMLGESGKTYILRLVTPDGVIYQSDSCRMPEPALLDSIYAEPGEIKTLEKNETGIYIEKIHPGISLYMDVLPAQGKEYYYRAETIVIKEAWHLEWRHGRPVPPGRPPIPTPVYCWEIPGANNDKDLISSSTPAYNPIKKRSLGFVTSDVYSVTDEIRDPSSLIGAITSTALYSITKHMYEIFSQLNTQTNPSNSIFDPIPTRVESNIVCVNEPSITVLGYFNVATVTRKSQFFRWLDADISKLDIDPIPVLPTIGNCESDIPPQFWINP